jgi:hypothetical protein
MSKEPTYPQEKSTEYRKLHRLAAQIWSDLAYVHGKISKARWDEIFTELSSSKWVKSGYVEGE